LTATTQGFSATIHSSSVRDNVRIFSVTVSLTAQVTIIITIIIITNIHGDTDIAVNTHTPHVNSYTTSVNSCTVFLSILATGVNNQPACVTTFLTRNLNSCSIFATYVVNSQFVSVTIFHIWNVNSCSVFPTYVVNSQVVSVTAFHTRNVNRCTFFVTHVFVTHVVNSHVACITTSASHVNSHGPSVNTALTNLVLRHYPPPPTNITIPQHSLKTNVTPSARLNANILTLTTPTHRISIQHTAQVQTAIPPFSKGSALSNM
jgi:hypothetical protein